MSQLSQGSRARHPPCLHHVSLDRDLVPPGRHELGAGHEVVEHEQTNEQETPEQTDDRVEEVGEAVLVLDERSCSSCSGVCVGGASV